MSHVVGNRSYKREDLKEETSEELNLPKVVALHTCLDFGARKKSGMAKEPDLHP